MLFQSVTGSFLYVTLNQTRRTTLVLKKKFYTIKIRNCRSIHACASQTYVICTFQLIVETFCLIKRTVFLSLHVHRIVYPVSRMPVRIIVSFLGAFVTTSGTIRILACISTCCSCKALVGEKQPCKMS